MDQINARPATQWERVSRAAMRCGISPRLFAAMVKRDPTVRIRRIGVREIVEVVVEDADALARRLEQVR